MKMPKLPVQQMVQSLSDTDATIIFCAFKPDSDELKAEQPFPRLDVSKGISIIEARANYVWRMLCFEWVHCVPYDEVPVEADWDIIAYWQRRALGPGFLRNLVFDEVRQMDTLIDKACRPILPGASEQTRRNRQLRGC